MRQPWETDDAGVCIPFQDRNASGNDNRNHGKES